MYTGGGTQELRLAESVTLKSGSQHATFQPGYIPVVIRAVAGVVTTSVASNSISAIFTTRLVSTASSIGSATLTFTTAATKGKVMYKQGLNLALSPGQELVVQSSGNADGAASLSIVFEPSPEVPANNTNMIASA